MPAPAVGPTVGGGGEDAGKSKEAKKVVKGTKNEKHVRHLRKAAGKIWNDKTLDDWPEEDYRVFIGDLGNEVTDDVLANSFRKFESFQKCRVVRDKRTGKSKGFGFVSFRNGEDFLKALDTMQGQYVGNRPIKVTRSKWKDREIDSERNQKMNELLVTTGEKSRELKKFKKIKPVTGGRKEKDKEKITAQWRPRRHFGHPAAFGVTLQRVLNNPVQMPNYHAGAALI
uniref:RRM domain-containing protein n=1 Tax=Chromera velia CCMP2878 TaxID=1169474 RepID=A0A0G4FGK3_9ALVE|eukprot:Cvel_16807.t1-p1 / transcript=Cvel_16807.t1 / gene=Cvel_16807 / organism=Chromera_velia_CCMP2878 / gene_product=RNA-binding protein 42, putative / transcript_product=RNA-binding protein 42, putative / location=Cvel_scaffold1312:43551-44228(+) / protein_length=226 / sequence_SO=supercontig / SO=protein_coding / is_pseudo=false